MANEEQQSGQDRQEVLTSSRRIRRGVKLGELAGEPAQDALPPKEDLPVCGFNSSI